MNWYTVIKDNPCWDGYEQIGMKEKNGKQVPNCVPIVKKSINRDIESIITDIEMLIANDADNNFSKVQYLQQAIDNLREAIRS